jgi:hypothetical protein
MNATDTARKLLVKQTVTSFKTDIVNMKYDKCIMFDTFENFAEITGLTITRQQIPDGCTVIKHGIYIILTHEVKAVMLHRINTGKLPQPEKLRQRWTLAHEIGHVHLEHSEDNALQEQEANSFAGELLMPELVLLELRRRLGRELTVSEAGRLFGVSRSAAENRLRQIQRRNVFSPYLKDELMAKYGKLISNYADMVGTPAVSALICAKGRALPEPAEGLRL